MKMLTAMLVLFVSHQALAALPGVTTVSSSGITISSANLNGSLTSLGGASDGATLNFEYGLTTTYGTSIDAVPSLGTAVPQAFTAVIAGLTCHTTYHFRARATTSAGLKVGADKSFISAACPTVVTAASSSITISSATLNGNMTSLGGATDTTLNFEYGVSTAYGTTVNPIPSSASAAPQAFLAALTGLTCHTTYHFRAKATTPYGSSVSADRSFLTAACPILATVTTVGSLVGDSSINLNGTLSSLGGAPSAVVGFEYGLTNGYGTSVQYTSYATSNGYSFNVVIPIASLSCGTTYHFRATASNLVGPSHGTVDKQFTTFACGLHAPIVTTGAPMQVQETQGYLMGVVNSVGGVTASPTTFGFDFGLTKSYGQNLVGNGSTLAGPQLFSYWHTTLTCNTTYHYRITATNSIGTSRGGDQSFTTTICPTSLPSVVTLAATGILSTQVTMNGALTGLGGGVFATVGVDYGHSATSYEFSTDLQLAGAIPMLPWPISTTLGGLFTCNTTYHYRMRATNSLGTVYGDDVAFTTAACP